MRDTYTVRQTAQLKLFADLAGEPWQQGKLFDKGRHRVHALADRARRAKVHHRRADEETLVVARAQSARLARFTAAIGAPLPRFRDGGGAQAGELLLEAVRRMALAYVLPGLGRSTRIRWPSRRARGVLGAALLALHKLGQSGRAEMSGSAAGDAFSP
jgi:hypothetical protein